MIIEEFLKRIIIYLSVFVTVVKWTIIMIIVIMARDNNRMAEMSIPPIPNMVVMVQSTSTIKLMCIHSLSHYTVQFCHSCFATVEDKITTGTSILKSIVNILACFSEYFPLYRERGYYRALIGYQCFTD